MNRPKGSGALSLGAGLGFVAIFIWSLFEDFSTVDPYVLFQAWLVIGGVIMIWWGAQRLAHADQNWRVGQDTINFVVGITAVTLALLTLVSEKRAGSAPERAPSRQVAAPGQPSR